jgi:hypothetical protein
VKRLDIQRSDWFCKLVSGGALTSFQAALLARDWPGLGGDVFAHPYLQTIREHTRAYLESKAQSCR